MTGVWFVKGSRFVAIKAVGVEAKALLARVEAGEHASVTFSDGPGSVRTVTVTGIEAWSATHKATPAFPGGKPVAECNYAERPEVRAQRETRARREQSADPRSKRITRSNAKAVTPVRTSAPTTDVGALLAQLAALSAQVAALSGGPVVKAAPGVKVPSAAQLAAREKFAAAAREKAAARKSEREQVAALQSAVVVSSARVREAASAPAVKAVRSSSSTCSACGTGGHARLYRHVGFDAGSVCDACMDLPAAQLSAAAVA